jgi:hypothetical protein
MSDIQKLTHGAELEGDTVRIPTDHPEFRFPKRGEGQAVAPYQGGVSMIVHQLEADQRKALGLPDKADVQPVAEDEITDQDPVDAPAAQETQTQH